MLLGRSPTIAWLERAADDPVARHPEHIPAELDFREHAEVFQHTYAAALPGVEAGFPLVLREGRLQFPEELTLQTRYPAFPGGGRFVGTFHVHPSGPGEPPAPFFDPGDLASTLRSDNPGFVYLLLAAEQLYALVRANPYLYIGGHHVDRNPLLLREPHEQLLRRRGAREPGDPRYAEQYRQASLYYFKRYQLALYEGEPGDALRRSFTPERVW